MAGESAVDSDDFFGVLKVPYHQTPDFQDYIVQNVDQKQLLSLMLDFLNNDFNYYPVLTPKIIHFYIFSFPNEDYNEPTIEIIFPQSEAFDRSILIHEFDEQFRIYLVENASTEEEYLKYRQLSRQFRILFSVEN